MSKANDRAPARAGLPLFYVEPFPLQSDLHASWRLVTGDYGFSAKTAAIPIVVGELAEASRFYPIVFAGDDAAPIAMVGFEQHNLFVEEGRWATGHYVPAYVRRYPFGFVQTADAERFSLAIDVESDRLRASGEEGTPLFEDGKPTDLTRQMLDFCERFYLEARATEDFSKALREAELLIDRRADASLPDGRKWGVHGFQIVDVARFVALNETTIVDWHRKGWLGLIQLHLASLPRLHDLLAKQSELVPGPSTIDATEAPARSDQPAQTEA